MFSSHTSRLSIVLLLWLTAFSGTSLLAQQDAIQPAWTIKVSRESDSTALLTATAKIPNGLLLFGSRPLNPEDPFVSSLTLANADILDTLPVQGTEQAVSHEAMDTPGKAFAGEAVYAWRIRLPLKDNAQDLAGQLQWLGLEGDGFPSGTEEIREALPEVVASAQESAAAGTADSDRPRGWGLFLVCVLVGFGAVFTPCVFPLMPVTVSFFLKKNKTRAEGIRDAWTYALSIILIYTIPTLLLTLLFGDKFLYQLSTHPVSNLLFFLIFLVFAISFFGAFEITLPSSWANKTDSAAQRGGLIGIFFMALTLVIVSFSCTGPIVGALLGETSSKGVSMGPVIGMLGFGVGLAIPFGLLALFPSVLKSLPRSGGWLNTVKVFFGFIELALAMKFLSNADLVYHWGLLPRDVFLASWIIIFTLLGLYLLGKLKFSHDSDLEYISVPRLFFAMASLGFALYMLPGMWGAPLKPLSGILPPPSTQDFDLDKLQYQTSGGHTSAVGGLSAAPAPVKYADKFHVPFGLTAYYDVEEAKQASRILRKPIMIDFTGWSCANCRKMENEVWSKPEVLQRLKEDFVLLSLYVDDRTPLPAAEQYTKPNGEKIRTIGDKNLDYEITAFNLNAQPLYKFMDHEGNILSDVQYGYDPDVSKFVRHLDAMKEAYRQRHP